MNEQIKIEDYEKGVRVKERGDTLHCDLLYPRNNSIKYINIGLSDVRAADDIRISYDFDRDGWKIEQYYINEIDKGSYIDATIEIWEEVGFFQAWALKEKGAKIK